MSFFGKKSFLDELEANKRKREAEQRKYEARVREEEAARQLEAQRQEVARRQYAQALTYYKESPCGQYLDGLVERIVQDKTFWRREQDESGHEIAIGRPVDDYYAFHRHPTLNAKWWEPRLGTYLGEPALDASLVWRTVVRMDQGYREHISHYLEWSLRIIVDGRGTVTVGDQPVPMDSWRQDERALDDAFRIAWNQACQSVPKRGQESFTEEYPESTDSHGIGD